MEKLKISVCITVLNEEKTVDKLLKSLFSQTKKADEIIIVDGGSNDKTVEIIKNYPKVLLVVSKGVSISKGRNIGIKKATGQVIVLTDAGCIPHKDWLYEITEPLHKKENDVVAGFYKMTGNSKFQRALKPFLGITPEKFNENFLPSARSMAFRKSVWIKVKGFNQKFDRAGEDTEFNQKLIDKNYLIFRNKKAVVDWEVPDNLKSACVKFFYYSRGDVQSGDFLSKHNLKVLTIFARYMLFYLFPLVFFAYLIYAYWKARFYGIIIQIASDFSVMAGYITGFIWNIQN